MGAARGGWRMPADFEPHECTWVAWPNENQTPGYTLKHERNFLELTAALKRYEPVRICAFDGPVLGSGSQLVRGAMRGTVRRAPACRALKSRVGLYWRSSHTGTRKRFSARSQSVSPFLSLWVSVPTTS